MTNRFPLTLDPLANQIREIAAGDSFDLTGNTVASDLVPSSPGTYSLGGLGFQWQDMHANNVWGTLQTGSQPSIFEVGTISAGQWQGDPISPLYGGTGTSLNPSAGAIVYTNSSSLALTPVGTSGQVLRSNGSGVPSWTDSLALSDLTVSSSLHLLDRKAIRFYEGNGGPNYVEVRAPLTIGSDYLLNLPVSDGSAGEVLSTDGSGNLSWIGNAGTSISNGDSSVFVSDNGVGGAIGFRTDNFLRWEIDSAGSLFPSTDGTYDLGLAAQRAANVFADNLYGEIAEGNQPNISGVGTITTGVWNGSAVDPAFGGTGVANPSGRTITLGGSISTSSSFQTTGNFGLTLNVVGTTNVTLPTSGTLLTSSVTSLPTLASIGTLTSLTCSGSSSLQGSVTLGTSASNILTINCRVASDFVPSTDNTRDLGSSSSRFAEAWIALANLNEARLLNRGPLKLYESTSNGSDYVGLQAPASLTGTVVWSLPTSDGSSGQVLKTDGAGNLSWITPATSAAAGSNTQVQYNSGGSFAASSNMTFDGTTLTVAGLTCSGTTTLGDATTDTVVFNSRVNSDLLPSTDNTRNLGSASNRWANIYTGDLHLKNDRGDWTLIEEEDALTIRNNKTGKVYDIMMSPRQA